MRRPKGYQCHDCAPKEWRRTPKMTGDYDFDETLMHRSNKDMPKKLKLYLRKSGPKTGYNSYHGYHGDD